MKHGKGTSGLWLTMALLEKMTCMPRFSGLATLANKKAKRKASGKEYVHVRGECQLQKHEFNVPVTMVLYLLNSMLHTLVMTGEYLGEPLVEWCHEDDDECVRACVRVPVCHTARERTIWK